LTFLRLCSRAPRMTIESMGRVILAEVRMAEQRRESANSRHGEEQAYLTSEDLDAYLFGRFPYREISSCLTMSTKKLVPASIRNTIRSPLLILASK